MKYDLLIQHGEVLDPGGRAQRAAWMSASPAARSSRSAPSLPENEARRTISARGLLCHARPDRHPRACLRQRARHGRAHRPFLPAERRHDLVRRRQHRLGDLRRAAPGARHAGAHPGARLCQPVGDRHRRHVARRRAVAFPLCRPGGLRPHDHREPRPRDRRQTALRAGPRLGIHHRAGQDGAPHRRDGAACR